MPQTEDVTRRKVAELLRATEAQHGREYAAVNGEDANWAMWYAVTLVQPLGMRLGVALESEALADELEELEAARKAAGIEDWVSYYAERLVAKHPG